MGLEVGSAVDNELVDRLVASGARAIFVALGAPKQEFWTQHHRERLPTTVIVGVGAALDIIAGRFREAPRWMTNFGLEWLFRLAQEPRRLAHRYLVDDPWVFWWAIKTRLGRGLRTPASEEEAE
jgi:N-acetylglucosaminyldiphosphoundecaprenol N-acetyl-beta-D-mannosaminyltransferase